MGELSHLVPDFAQIVRITSRLLAALAVGTAIGLQRELTHKTAGLRTHMLVALGTALFIVGAAESGTSMESLGRVIQGIAAGIGFLGGGTILKLTDQRGSTRTDHRCRNLDDGSSECHCRTGPDRRCHHRYRIRAGGVDSVSKSRATARTSCSCGW